MKAGQRVVWLVDKMVCQKAGMKAALRVALMDDNRAGEKVGQ